MSLLLSNILLHVSLLEKHKKLNCEKLLENMQKVRIFLKSKLLVEQTSGSTDSYTTLMGQVSVIINSKVEVSRIVAVTQN